MADYRLSLSAKEDLLRIHSYGVEVYGTTQADQYLAAIFEHFELIAAFPYSFQAVDQIRIGYRRCVCGSESIYYRIRNNKVEIMAILGRQQP